MKATGATLLVLALLVLHGCASMSQEECMAADWQAIGYEDGARGAPGATIGEHREACAEHGVTPDLAAYRKGRAQGLEEYCQPHNGFRLGVAGNGYSSACPPRLASEFTSAYRAGRQLYELTATVRHLTRQIEAKQSEVDALQAQITEKETALVGEEPTMHERAQMLIEIRELARRQGEIKDEIADLERRRAVQKERVQSYQASLEDDYY